MHYRLFSYKPMFAIKCVLQCEWLFESQNAFGFSSIKESVWSPEKNNYLNNAFEFIKIVVFYHLNVIFLSYLQNWISSRIKSRYIFSQFEFQ
jgi:hypothetical protein